jgi:hypothetical protein
LAGGAGARSALESGEACNVALMTRSIRSSLLFGLSSHAAVCALMYEVLIVFTLHVE